MTRINIFIFGYIVLVYLICCTNKSNNRKDKENFSDIFSKVYSTDKLKSQIFTIDNSIDNLITGESGTIIRIDKNVFVDQSGKTVKGIVEVKLIEALTPIDMVLGNLTTTFNNKPLETGGMIYLQVLADNKELIIAPNQSIQIKMPCDSTLSNMSLFEGQQDSLGIKWNNPIQISNIDTLKNISVDLFEKTTNVKYSVDGFDINNDPPEVSSEVGRICWEGDGLKIRKDSVFKIDNYTVRFYKQKKLLTYSESFANIKGENSYAQDRKTNYIFSIKKLGWANIDRLLEDPRTEDVDFITSIENHTDFQFIYVTMITQKMYLPGYQKKDNTFSFSHNDEEKQQLPIGETATILATAYKNDMPYFAIKKINISKKQLVSFKLEKTTQEKLKKELKEKI